MEVKPLAADIGAMAAPTPDTLAQWWHYEELAMHFNGLIMQFRIQVLGGAGAIGALGSYVVNKADEVTGERNRLRAIVATGLWILILGAAMLDLFYYRQLLQGAVNAIITFEKEHPEIQISTEIEHVTGWGKQIIFAVYAVLIFPLGGFMIWSWFEPLGGFIALVKRAVGTGKAVV